jgi:hypothetical protein
MANNSNKKELIKQLEKEIDSGFELFEEYKKKSEEFVENINKTIAESNIDFGFKNTNSLTYKKEKLAEHFKKIKEMFESTGKQRNSYINEYLSKYNIMPSNIGQNEIKENLYEKYVIFGRIIKKIVELEIKFITYKREKRKEKLRIYQNINTLKAELEKLYPEKKEYNKLLKKLNEKKYTFKGKVYTLKHILGHLKAGQISNSVNDSVVLSGNLQKLLNREKKMVQNIKEMRNIIKSAENKEKKKEKTLIFLKELKKIMLKINKIYEKKLVGANIPKDIYETIKIIEKQTISQNDKEKFDKLKKQFTDLVSKIEKLKASS